VKAYSLDLRTKIVQSVRRRGISISETACRFGVNRSTIGRYLKRLDEGGSLAPKKAPGSPSKLDESAMRLLEDASRLVLGLLTGRGRSSSSQLVGSR
jgi:transposase